MTKFVPFLIWLLLFWRLIFCRPWTKRQKLIGGISLAVLISPYHLLRLGANYFPGSRLGDLPFEVWLAAQFLFCTACFLTVLTALELVLKPIAGWIFRKKTEGDRFLYWPSFPVLLLASALFSALGIRISLMEPLVREYEVKLKNYPAGAGELRIAAVSDLHFDPVYDSRYAARIVSKLNSLKPDVILLLGDYSNTRSGITPEVLAELKKLSAPEGVYAVTGNHEYYREGWNNFHQLNSAGIRFLCNEHAELKKGGVFLAGVNDPGAKQEAPREFRVPRIGAAVKDIPPGRPVILMSHQPKLLEDAVDNGVGLQLSGHIHGGLFPAVHWIMALFKGPVHGYYRKRDTDLIVSAGTGIWCGFPCRFGILPEILLVTVSR